MNEDKSAKQRDTYTMGLWRRLRKDRFAMTSLCIVALLFAVAYLAPVLANDKPIAMRYEGKWRFPAAAELAPFSFVLDYPELRGADFDRLREDGSASVVECPVPYSPFETSLGEKLLPPSGEHWLGTDELGRDILSRMIHGSRISLSVGFVAVAIALVIGLAGGALAGYYGGAIDVILSRLIEVVMCFPVLFLILAVIAFLPPSIFSIMAIIGLTRWTTIARYTRGEFLRIKKQEYADAARAIGASNRKIIVRHILPNSLAPVLVAATFGIANAILIEAALGFLGLGVPPPLPSWGGILSLAKDYIDVAWWIAVVPGFAIFITVTAYNILGEGLRDASDPRHASRRA